MKNIKTDSNRVLLVGIGNSGRKDDGLGWQFAEYAELMDWPFLDVEYRYQLQVEDVMLISRYNKIYFADASHGKMQDGFECKPCTAAQHYFFSSHLQTPETILYLAKELFDKSPEAFTIAMEGQDWGLGTEMSTAAIINLDKALAFFKKKLVQGVVSAGQLH